MSEQAWYLIKDREQSAVAESFRALRNSIQSVESELPLKTVLFASASPGAGSALAAANTAATLAYAGKKVILIDGDLRKPLLQDVFSLADRGLTNLIEENLSLSDVLQASSIENLQILTSGPVPLKPFELLSKRSVRSMLEEAKERADYVVINSSPLLVVKNTVVSDACILAAKVNGVVFVVDAMTVRVKAAQKALALLKRTGSRMIGIVLNDVKDDQDFVY